MDFTIMTFSFNTSFFPKIFLLSLVLMTKGQEGHASCAENEDDNSAIPCAAAPRAQSPVAMVEVKDKDSDATAKHLAVVSKLFTNDMAGFQKDRIKDALAYLSIEQVEFFVESITQNAEKLFGKEVSGLGRGLIPIALAKLNFEQVKAVLQQADNLFTADMSGTDRLCIINSLLPLSPKKIEAVAQWGGNLFSAGMNGYDRTGVIDFLAPLSPKQIEAVSMLFEPKDDVMKRIEKIKAYAAIEVEGFVAPF